MGACPRSWSHASRPGRPFGVVAESHSLGSARFLTVVGITADELDRMKATTTAEILSELAKRSPMLVTDPTR
ncbi:suppressor of fused domain protein [Micromonospora taraxaci]|uniref:suppressor of fused domain protein n=1 Tax=Micromonospora taraxaci TaxID=1316803 RepID=UPI0033E7DBAD